MPFTTVKANAVLFVVYLSFKAYTMDLSFVRLFCLLLNQLIRPIDLLPEAFSRRCSVKMLFLKIWQNSQENTCVSLFFKSFLTSVSISRFLTSLKQQFRNPIFGFLKIAFGMDITLKTVSQPWWKVVKKQQIKEEIQYIAY